ncbi:MAG: HipA N-terminal domain-containing protein [Chitinispirillaceae bacterium]|nr:HipA N-terminal domain-containing protein [Chitinispirillaceae bacterium]
MNNNNIQAKVFFKEIFAGILLKSNDEYLFTYDKDYLKNKIPISMSLPLREEPYRSKELFPFFKGLLPEGWYLDIVSMSQKVDIKDYFGLLISTSASDTTGAVTVRRA